MHVNTVMSTSTCTINLITEVAQLNPRAVPTITKLTIPTPKESDWGPELASLPYNLNSHTSTMNFVTAVCKHQKSYLVI